MYSQDLDDVKGSVDFDFFEEPVVDKGSTSSSKANAGNGNVSRGEQDRQRQRHDVDRENCQPKQDRKNEVRVPSGTTVDSDQDDISDIEEDFKSKKHPSKSLKEKGGGIGKQGSHKPKYEKKGTGGREVWGDSHTKTKSSSGHKAQRDGSPYSDSDRSDYEEERGRSKKQKDHAAKSRSRSRSSSAHTYSGSDFESDDSADYTDGSDITDVSPLQSPHKIKTPKSDGKVDRDRKPADRSETAVVDEELREHLIQAKSKGMDLNMLMHAVMELEKEEQEHYARLGNSKSSKKITFDRSTKPGSSFAERKNFSFKDDRIRDIDKENTRLMQEIVRNHTRRKPAPVYSSPWKKVTHSAVNRTREQRRIEMENMKMLQRLESAKPTRTLCKDKLINEFENKSIAGIKVYGYRRPKSRYSNPTKTFSDTTSVRSDYTMSSEGRRSRPTSASTQSSSTAQMKMVHSRPEWSDRW